jgi:spermidine synthase
MGGLFVGLVAPAVFRDFLELHWGLLLCAVLFAAVCFRDRFASMGRPGRWLAVVATVAGLVGLDFLMVRMNAKPVFHTEPYFLTSKALMVVRFAVIGLFVTVVAVMGALGAFRNFVGWRWVTITWMAAGSAALGVALVKQATSDTKAAVYRSRNFYGTLAITEQQKADTEEHRFVLQHGRITHGLQFTDPAKSRLPTTYYGHESGVGMALDAFTNRVRHVGVIGLGTGTIATHGRPGDRFRLYEINPEVISLAWSRFSYLTNSEAKIDVVLGDARLSLEKEPPQEFDVLALDAFSSDAIPVHLLTKEAFALYARHMRTNGIIAVHISNRYLDLEPVVLNLAKQFSYKVAAVEFDDEDKEDNSTETEWFYYSSTWMLLTNDPDVLTAPAIQKAVKIHQPSNRKIPLWTDDFASLFQVLE